METFTHVSVVLLDYRQNLELFKARDVMHSPVITITPRETLAHLAHLLLETTHGGFPVVRHFGDAGCEVAYGLLTRYGRHWFLLGVEDTGSY